MLEIGILRGGRIDDASSSSTVAPATELDSHYNNSNQREIIPGEIGSFGEPFFFSPKDEKVLSYACHNYTCKTCGPIRGDQTKRAIGHAAAEFGLCYLYTLTLPSNLHGDDPLKARKWAARSWNAFATKMKKRRKKDGDLFRYIMTYEPHKDGTCHIHFISDLYLLSRELAEAWNSLGGGFSSTKGNFGRREEMTTEDGEIDEKDKMRGSYRVGHYVGKYITKGSGTNKMSWDSYACTDGGGYRKAPWRRWTAPRIIAKYISSRVSGVNRKVKKTDEVGEWRLVRADGKYLINERLLDAYPRWTGGSRKEGCAGHLYGTLGACGVRTHSPPSTPKVPLCGYQVLKQWSEFSKTPPSWLLEDGLEAWGDAATRFELFKVDLRINIGNPKPGSGYARSSWS